MTSAQSARYKKRFLDSFRVLGNVTAAAEAAGVQRRRVYDWLKADADFASEFAEAEAEATEVLEAEARRRAVDGVTQETPLFYKGEQLGSILKREYSDTLLIFLLKARAPGKYRERHEMEIEHRGNVTVTRGADLSLLDDRELRVWKVLATKATPDDLPDAG